MSYLYIEEVQSIGIAKGGAVLQALKLPGVANQRVTFSSGAATPSDPFSDNVVGIRVLADADCHIKVGASPTAGATDLPLAANVAEVFTVTPGHKLSVFGA